MGHSPKIGRMMPRDLELSLKTLRYSSGPDQNPQSSRSRLQLNSFSPGTAKRALLSQTAAPERPSLRRPRRDARHTPRPMHVGASSGRSDRGAGASVFVDRRVTVFSANGRLDQVGECAVRGHGKPRNPKLRTARRLRYLMVLHSSSASPLQITRGTPRGWRASPRSASAGRTPSASSTRGRRARPR